MLFLHHVAPQTSVQLILQHKLPQGNPAVRTLREEKKPIVVRKSVANKISELYYKYAHKYLEGRHNFLLALFGYCKQDNPSLAAIML